MKRRDASHGSASHSSIVCCAGRTQSSTYRLPHSQTPLPAMWVTTLTTLALLTLCGAASTRQDPGLYDIGVGKYDITGPAAGVILMGYANPTQINRGIHIRLFARAYIIDDGTTRMVFVSADSCMTAQIVKIGVVEQLQKLYGDQYTSSNVMISSTHSHSGPGGFLQYILLEIPSFGFMRDSYDAIVDGIVKSISHAHDNMTPGRLYLSVGELLEASINRSPSSYLYNPQEERDRYQHDTDKNMTLLKLVAEDGTHLGMINWFAVHGTSMNNTNHLVSGDNKGYASQLFEQTMNPESLVAEGAFVAAFAQSNLGDVSPNTAGPHCQDTGEPCDVPTSTCGGRTELCIAGGPGKDMEESTKIIAIKQYEMAMELYNDSSLVPVTGPVQIVGQQIDMSDYEVVLDKGTKRTCKAALGFSFAAGTTDGPGMFDFTQGMTVANPFWSMIVDFIYVPSQQQIDCQHPKPILLDTGDYNVPYAWHPKIVETQLARIGQLVLIAVPGEFTTMSGRRMREQVTSVLASEGITDTVPVIAGLSNIYTHYITTNEEYGAQRYEAASTIYGPHTLSAYLQQYSMLASAMAKGETVPPGPDPPNMLDELITLMPGVIFDGVAPGYAFGDVLAQPYPFAYSGETIYVKFVSGHPRNDMRLGGSFLTVEKEAEDGSWEVVATDADWCTKFQWERTSTLLGTSLVTVSWTSPEDTPKGTYRITHAGSFKTLRHGITSYSGTTDAFQVAPKTSDIKAREEVVEALYNNGRGIATWIAQFFGY